MKNTAYQLTPSEIELIKANPESDEVIFGNLTRKLQNGDPLALLNNSLKAAISANEDAGIFEFRCLTQRSFLGLLSSSQLVVHLRDRRHSWPEPSLEAILVDILGSHPDQGEPVTISEMIRRWLGCSAINHVQNAITWIFDALVERGWVQRQSENRLNLFCLTSYMIPESTARLAHAYAHSNKPSVAYPQSVSANRHETDLMREIERALSLCNLYTQ